MRADSFPGEPGKARLGQARQHAIRTSRKIRHTTPHTTPQPLKRAGKAAWSSPAVPALRPIFFGGGRGSSTQERPNTTQEQWTPAGREGGSAGER